MRVYTYIVPRSDEEDFYGCVAGNVRAAARVLTRIYDNELRNAGLRVTQVALLAQVRRLQPVSVGALAEALASERSAVARDLQILVRDGLVAVRANAADQRVREVRLTAAGNRRLRAAAAGWRLAQQRVHELLGARRVNDLVTLAGDVVEAFPPT